MPMYKAQALIVDTDIPLYDISVGLWASYGIKSHRVDNIEQALKELSENTYQLLVIVENKAMRASVLNSIKVFPQLTEAPLVIASRDSIDADYRIIAHDLGADEVWEMPIIIHEAVAKGNAIIRRYTENKKKNKTSKTIVEKCILLSAEHRLVLVNGQKVELAKKEFDILRFLMTYKGKVLSYEQIFRHVWGEEYSDNPKKNLRSQIERLRKKIQIEPNLPDFIKTYHGIGYSFDP